MCRIPFRGGRTHELEVTLIPVILSRRCDGVLDSEEGRRSHEERRLSHRLMTPFTVQIERSGTHVGRSYYFDRMRFSRWWTWCEYRPLSSSTWQRALEAIFVAVWLKQRLFALTVIHSGDKDKHAIDRRQQRTEDQAHCLADLP